MLKPPLFASLLLTIAALCTSTAHAEVVKIAFIDVLSGPFAAAGKSSLDQLRAVVEARNAKAKGQRPRTHI